MTPQRSAGATSINVIFDKLETVGMQGERYLRKKALKIPPGGSGVSDGMNTHVQSIFVPAPQWVEKVRFECPHHLMVSRPLTLHSQTDKDIICRSPSTPII